ncbi:hypothetical protein QBC39DRAFT_74287 [Podospora conica]|nr:hypothetical protein QBC39DRAFT_74287 [Schizothecium conicum]
MMLEQFPCPFQSRSYCEASRLAPSSQVDASAAVNWPSPSNEADLEVEMELSAVGPIGLRRASVRFWVSDGKGDLAVAGMSWTVPPFTAVSGPGSWQHDLRTSAGFLVDRRRLGFSVQRQRLYRSCRLRDLPSRTCSGRRSDGLRSSMLQESWTAQFPRTGSYPLKVWAGDLFSRRTPPHGGSVRGRGGICIFSRGKGWCRAVHFDFGWELSEALRRAVVGLADICGASRHRHWVSWLSAGVGSVDPAWYGRLTSFHIPG